MFNTTPILHPIALVMHCFDERFEPANSQFIAQKLSLPRGKRKRLSLPGGPARLAYRNAMPEQFRAIISDIRFVVGKFPTIKRIILIAHYDCKYYEIPEIVNGCGYDLNRAKNDLFLARDNLIKESFSEMDIQAYYARLSWDCSEALYEKVF